MKARLADMEKEAAKLKEMQVGGRGGAFAVAAASGHEERGSQGSAAALSGLL